MRIPRVLIALICLALSVHAGAADAVVHPQPDARRLEVMFLGAPTANSSSHDPITRYRILKKALGTSGINLTYSQDLNEAFDPAFINQFDALLLYGNWNTLAPEQERTLLQYVESGHGFLPIHCASACFGNSDAFINLVGARFRRHGGEIFSPHTVAPDHESMQGLPPLEAWDETYVHDRHADDRTILQVRQDPAGDEPWTWVRSQGAGRVFYTASGHDHRVWDEPAFHDLLRNGILWAVGPETKARLDRLDLPQLAQQEVLLPGYRHRQAITEAQAPLTAVESAKLIQVPPGFEVSLFASEPDILNPIFVSWDHRGRAFVVETIDYPNNLQSGNIGHDKITICEDTNGDGRADKFTVFAEGLSIPTSLTFANGGVICTNGTQLLFLKDTNGDDRADVREVLLDGFSMRDTHAGPSNLRYGFDNWIYATVGYSGFAGDVSGVRQEFSQGLFRLSPDGRKVEYLQPTTNNTWGLGFTEEFTIMGSTANANPSWVYTFPEERYRAMGLSQPRTPRADDNPYFFPSSMDIRQVDVMDRYTAGAGHAFYTARRFPSDFHNRVAFVTEPTGKLVGTFEVESDGASFVARQRPNNIFNSADAWTSPVAAEVGPDGALWVCDWYNLIIQHNPTPSVASSGVAAERGQGNAYSSPLRDVQYGRIWRVYPSGSNAAAMPTLDPARSETLVSALDHPNMLWRLHAQRLLVEGGHRAAAGRLREIAQSGGVGAVHALHALDGLGQIDAGLIETAWRSDQFALRRAARDIGARAFPAVVGRLALATPPASVTSNPREFAEVLVALSRVQPTDELGQAVFRMGLGNEEALVNDPVLLDAWQIAARAHGDAVIRSGLAANLPLEGADQRLAGQILQLVAWRASAQPESRAALIEQARRADNDFARYIATSLAAPAPRIAAREFEPDPEVHARGAQVYANTCVACHGLDGRGVVGAFPPLAESEWLTGDPSIPIRIVTHGLQGPIDVGGTTFTSIMPPVVGLSDGDAASVITYVRQAFGNDASPVTQQQVQAIRRRLRGREDLWTAEELKAPLPAR